MRSNVEILAEIRERQTMIVQRKHPHAEDIAKAIDTINNLNVDNRGYRWIDCFKKSMVAIFTVAAACNAIPLANDAMDAFQNVSSADYLAPTVIGALAGFGYSLLSNNRFYGFKRKGLNLIKTGLR